MISASARPYIAASVPVLREHGLAITRDMYTHMLAAHPELRAVFNLGNQANGSQQVALANAVFAYAANIDNPAALAPVALRIAHKHASLGIKPSHYPIVARHLLGAIQRVLGDAATPALIAAWDEAYWLLAGELIAAEATLYERARQPAGALRRLTVVDARRETPDTRSLYLQTADRQSPGSFAPGQYVSVAIDAAAVGCRQLRQYSLSSAPDQPAWRITVKRVAADGAAPAGMLSSFLHDEVQPGDTLEVSAPFGEFAPLGQPERPLVLVSAGVGITPMVSALASLPTATARPVWFAHAAASPAHHVLGADVAQLAAERPNVRCTTWYEADAPTGALRGRMLITAEQLAPYAGADVFLCGPLPFMQAQWRALLDLGVPAERMHRELFGPEALDHLL